MLYSYLLSNFIQLQSFKEKIEVEGLNNIVILKMNEDNADLIREWALDRLEYIGFDENSELTNDGVILEEIIDLFYV